MSQLLAEFANRSQRATYSFCVALLLLAACGKSGSDVASTSSKVDAGDGRSAQSKERPVWYNAQGELLESSKVVAGLVLPESLSTAYEEERRHVYESAAPVEKLHRYFGQRLLTGVVEKQGQAAIFRAAVPKGARGGVVKLDVTIRPVAGKRTRIYIDELRPAPAQPLSDQQVRSLLKKEQQQLQ